MGFACLLDCAAFDDPGSEVNFDLVTFFDIIHNIRFQKRKPFIECVAIEYAGKGLGDNERYAEG